MAGINNKTARQYNLKCIANKKRHLVRIAPGLNEVDDIAWAPFKTDAYTKGLKEEGLIDFGKKVDDMLVTQDPDTKSKSKVQSLPKPIASPVK